MEYTPNIYEAKIVLKVQVYAANEVHALRRLETLLANRIGNYNPDLEEGELANRPGVIAIVSESFIKNPERVIYEREESA